ncbi:MAG: NAD(P)-dependent oxidoreductase [Caulobacterales bacterium 68-7]|nr:SDR family NAD(P)-dependent oxidoreductase [Caulobacterales bacterium]OJU12258.1 MAG: NAD(P)-dependent oxidoreductase [Caulobacterales bacterium 68-7]
MKLFLFGHSYTGQALMRRLAPEGWSFAVTARDPSQAEALRAAGHEAVDPADRFRTADALADADAILISAPPTSTGCPGLESMVPALALAQAFPDWIGYLSTTGVYGDRGGRWVFEDSPLSAQSVEGARRVGAERDWRQVGRGMGLTVCAFRLPGIYGPGRSALDKLREGVARRPVKPGQVFGRCHVDDIAAGLAASIAAPRAGASYNLCDDEPAPSEEVTAYAARLLGMEPPPAVAWDAEPLSAGAARFWAENRRVSNARAKAELGWQPQYPSYREGLEAILKAGG